MGIAHPVETLWPCQCRKSAIIQLDEWMSGGSLWLSGNRE